MGTKIKIDGKDFFTNTSSGDIVDIYRIGDGYNYIKCKTRFGVNHKVQEAFSEFPTSKANYYEVSGTTTVDTINSDNFQAGSELTMFIIHGLTLKNMNGGSGQMHLKGNADFAAEAGTIIKFILTMSDIWFEVSRTLFEEKAEL